MKDLIEFIAKSLVDHPETVQVRESGGGSRVRIELSVSKDDMGRVIGKKWQGRKFHSRTVEGRC